MSLSTIPTKFLIISDTHDLDFAGDKPEPFQLPTPKVDVLLHCGDLTESGGLNNFERALHMLSNIDAELKLVIAGNHDLELDAAYWQTQCESSTRPQKFEDHTLATNIMTGDLAVKAGVTYLSEGTHTFTLKNGATFKIFASPYTPAFSDWAFAYEASQDRFNSPAQVAKGAVSISPNPIPNDVDIVMTHGPPKGVLDWCSQGYVGCPNLLQAIRRVKPLMHCFGHVHEGAGVEAIDWRTFQPKDESLRKNEALHRFFEEEELEENCYPESQVWKGPKGSKTLAVNAALMTGEQRPENKPRLVSLDLRKKDSRVQKRRFEEELEDDCDLEPKVRKGPRGSKTEIVYATLMTEAQRPERKENLHASKRRWI